MQSAHRPEGGGDELRAVRELVDHVGDGLPMHRVECRVDLVEEVERRRVALLDGEDQRQRHKRLLPAGKLRIEKWLVGVVTSYR